LYNHSKILVVAREGVMGERLRIEGDGNRFQLHGEFDRTEVDRFSEALTNVDSQAVEVDLGGVTFIDSSALRALMDARLAHAGLRYANPSTQLVRLAKITQLQDVLFGN
jgi:anti-anti-sigma factor